MTYAFEPYGEDKVYSVHYNLLDSSEHNMAKY